MTARNSDVLCEGCGATLTNFLREMADHNATVVCPVCGKVYSQADLTALANDPPSDPGTANC